MATDRTIEEIVITHADNPHLFVVDFYEPEDHKAIFGLVGRQGVHELANPVLTEAASLQELERMLGFPVFMTSRGPTHLDKTIRKSPGVPWTRARWERNPT